jgi:magnesium transporter
VAFTTSLYRDGARSRESLPFERVSDVLREKGVLVWVDVDDPSLEETAQLGEEFGLHPFALEDAMTPHQRPKIERYEGYVFVVAYAARAREGTGPEMHEVSMFVAGNYVVTIRHGGGTMLDAARERIDRTPSLVRGGGSQVAYVMLDEIIDGYFPVVEAFEDRIERAEDDLIGDGSGDASGSLAEAFQIKRDLLTFRRVVAPLRDVLGRVVHIDQSVLGVDLDTEFRDLYDHVLRVYDELDTQRDLVTSILEAHLSVVSNRLNLVVLKLSSWAAIVLVPTLIAGVYGMNFDHMPELHWRLGYAYSLVLMGGSALVLWFRFKRAGWL